MAAPKKVIVTLDNRSDKKSVVRFDGNEDGALTNVYISKDAVKALGDPQAVKITIEAA